MSLYGTSTCIFDWCPTDSFLPIWQVEAMAEQESQYNPYQMGGDEQQESCQSQYHPQHQDYSSSSPSSDFGEEEPMVLSSTIPTTATCGGPPLRLSVNTETDHNDPMVISPRSNGVVSWGDTPSNPPNSPCTQNGCLPTPGAAPCSPQQPLQGPFSFQAQPSSWNFGGSVLPGSPLPPGSPGGVVGVGGTLNVVGGPHVHIHPHQQSQQQGGLHLPQQLHHLYDHGGFENNRFAQPPHEVLQKLELGRLEVSKSPIMEALVFCAFAGWGVELVNDSDSDISFRVWDFNQYYEMSALICSKQRPTEDESSRIKALKRWFPDFPSSRERRRSDGPFMIHVRSSNAKDNKPKKLRAIIDKTRELVGITKTRHTR